MTEWKWFETTVLEIHKKATCFYFLVQYTRKCINFNYLSHKQIKLCVIYSKWKNIYIRNQSQRSRDLADENNKIFTEWKWFDTTVLEIHIKTTCFYFLVQYTLKYINCNQLSHKPIKLCVIYSKWKKKYILGINHRDHMITLKRK